MDNVFYSQFRKHLVDDKISKGDKVQIIGKDEYKGLFGTVTNVEEISGSHIYTIELSANSKRIERFEQSLRKEFSS